MKYIIKNSDLFINNKLYSEGSEIELSQEQIKGIESFLIPLNSHSERSEESITENYPIIDSGSKEKRTKIKGNKK